MVWFPLNPVVNRFVKNKQTIFANFDNFLVVFLLIEGKSKLYLEKFDKLANSSIDFVKNKLTLFANLIKSFDKFSLLMGDISLVDEELIELAGKICK